MPTYREQVLADGAVLYLRLDETSGTTVTSQVGGHTGTIGGGVTLNQPGALADGNAAMVFNVASGEISIGSAHNIVADLTLEAWVKKAVAGTYAQICSCGQTIAVNIPYEWNINPDNTVALVQANGTTRQVMNSTGTITTNVYCHVVVTRAGSAVSFFIDGIQAGTATATVTPTAIGAVAWIARRNGDTNYRWNGALDEVAIYPTALTPAQIANHYALRLDIPSPPPYSRVQLPAADRPFNLWQPLTPSDQTDRPFASLWCGQAGTVAAVMQDGVVGAFTVPAGAIVPIMGRRVNSTGTTVSSILALGTV